MRKFVVITRWDDIPLVFDIPIMVRLLGRSYDSVKKMCLQGKIPAFKLGNEWRFDKRIIQRWIEAGGENPKEVST